MPTPTGDDRRGSKRQKVRCAAMLRAGLALLSADFVDDCATYPLNIYGDAQDVSELGISFIVTCVRIDVAYCNGGPDHKILVTLELPTRPVEIAVKPVRCSPIDANDPDRGFFVATEILEINEADRTLLRDYLESISSSDSHPNTYSQNGR